MIDFAQFSEAVPTEHLPFVQQLHGYMLDAGCKITFEEKKSGYLASIKFGKPPRALANFLFRKPGMLVRIYGENIGGYLDFLNSLPAEMVSSIQGAGICKRLVHNTCSPKCTGYDFKIGNEHFQKCRYNCFEFLVNDQNNLYIKTFLEHELNERTRCNC